ncbi:unnamed protein product [Prunus armeniaca]|nr:hypothetical protein GBA52_021076 [Prunus armeniaca]
MHLWTMKFEIATPLTTMKVLYIWVRIRGHFCTFIKRKESYSNADRLFVDNKMRDSSLLSSSSVSVTSNGYPENLVSRPSGSERPLEHSFLLPNEVPGKHSGSFLDDAANADFSAAVDKGESSIIQKYLPMDFDTWDDSIASPQHFSKLLGETDRLPGCSSQNVKSLESTN